MAAALGLLALFGRLAQGGPAAAAPAPAAPAPPLPPLPPPPPPPPPQILPTPSALADLFLPPPAVPPIPPQQPGAAAADAAGPAFSIQTIGVDVPAGAPSGGNKGAAAPVDVVEVAMTPTAAAGPPEPTSAPENDGSGGGSEKGPGRTPPPPFSGECRLMGPFAIFVQLGLGGLALLSLVYKRWRERPQRPVKIWFFDVSKQVFGSVLVHVANVFMSLLTSGRFSIKLEPTVVSTVAALVRRDGDSDEPYVPNPCSFYLLNLAIDTTLGIPILIFLLRLTTAIISYTPLGQPPASIQSGNYGRPPNAWWWLKQSLLYFCGLFGMKICVLVIFLTLPWISHVGDWALRWTEGNEQLQIVFVMMLFPLIMNALQYYIIDSFIKEQPTPEQQQQAAAAAAARSSRHRRRRHRGDGVGLYDRLSDAADDDTDEDSSSDDGVYGHELGDSSTNSDEEDEVAAAAAAAAALRRNVASTKGAATTTTTTATPVYDPALDGDSPTVIGSSSSQRSQQGRSRAADDAAKTPKELFPPE